MDIKTVTDEQLQELGINVISFRKSSETMQKATLQRYSNKKKAEEASDDNSISFNSERIKPEWAGVEKGTQKVFRLIGKPYEFRTEPYDSKFVFYSDILEDDSKFYIGVYWPVKENEKKGTKEVDSNFILKKMYDKVQQGDWEKYDEPVWDSVKGKPVNGKKHYDYEGTPSYTWMMSDFGNSKQKDIEKNIGKKFKYTSKVLINVIDKNDSWCIDNKATKLLSDYVRVYEGVDEKTGEPFRVTYNNIGISASFDTSFYVGAYDKIFDHYVMVGQDLEDSDVILKRNDGFEVYDATDSPDRYFPAVKDIASCEPLTEEERNYKKIDIDELTSNKFIYQTLLKYLSARFKQFDLDCGTKFYDELVQLAKDEKEKNKNSQIDKTISELENESNNTEQIEEKKETPFDDSDIPFKDDNKENFKEEKKVRRSVSSNIESELIDEFKENFENWEKLDEYNKNQLKANIIKFENGAPVYKSDLGMLDCDSPSCKFKDGSKTKLPETVTICPVCGLVYEVD